jgi:hypothetical protein
MRAEWATEARNKELNRAQVQKKSKSTFQGVCSMKGYIPVISAAVLLIIALGLIVTGVSNLAGLPVLGTGDYAHGYLAAGNFSGGVFSAGFFSAGVFAAGVFAIGVFSIGIFSVGIFSVGIFTSASLLSECMHWEIRRQNCAV